MEPKELLLLAKGYGHGAHAHQKYGTRNYVEHLAEVAQVAKDFEMPPEVEAAAWLHDTIEDTTTRHKELKALFGETVANLVWAVTNDEAPEPGYKERTYQKTAKYGWKAMALKLCDRIANVEACFDETGEVGEPRLYKKYLEDHVRLAEAFAGTPELEPLLERLAQALAGNKAAA
jgi:(p)ppGpp synthase/HD superfamily hydrolase